MQISEMKKTKLKRQIWREKAIERQTISARNEIRAGLWGSSELADAFAHAKGSNRTELRTARTERL